MKGLLLQYARYNLWANRRIMDLLLSLEEETLDREMISSFASLRQTVYHLWGAEDIWLQRLHLVEHPQWRVKDYTGSFAGACEAWTKVSSEFVAFIEKQFDDRSFSHVFQYYNSRREHFKNDVGSVLLHVFNHATYHRGQLVTMLRNAGVTKIPATDFIVFIRNPK